ncbi:MAG: hypothetical protein L6R39_000562, partial [Caloplaca ligustica]
MAWMSGFLACVAWPLEADSPSSSTLQERTPNASTRTVPSRRNPDLHRLSRSRRPPNTLISDHQQQKQQPQHPSRRTLSPQPSKRGSGGSQALTNDNNNNNNHNPASYDILTHSFQNFGVIIPIPLASFWIRSFLELIALRIELGTYSALPPSNHRVFRVWDFELEFLSADAAVMIPWEFVQGYVLELVED